MSFISFREIKPTKTNLINLQKKLNFALRGEKFLQFKQEQLMTYIKERYNSYLKEFNQLKELYKECLFKLNQTYKEMGKRDLILISKISKIQYNPLINAKNVKVIGLNVYELEFNFSKESQLPAYSFENTSHFLDDLIVILGIFLEQLILTAQKEDECLKFAFSFKKINRRINGLKNIIIPNLGEEIKKIKEILEEIDRENFVRLKKTKDLIKRNEKEVLEDVL